MMTELSPARMVLVGQNVQKLQRELSFYVTFAPSRLVLSLAVFDMAILILVYRGAARGSTTFIWLFAC